eukprot:4043515-Pleurochrysis_carterae.AAC.1
MHARTLGRLERRDRQPQIRARTPISTHSDRNCPPLPGQFLPGPHAHADSFPYTREMPKHTHPAGSLKAHRTAGGREHEGG